MAIYEYHCPRCGNEFEERRPISAVDRPATCPKCKGKAEKLVSVVGTQSNYYVRPPERPAFRQLAAKGPGGSRAGKVR